MSLIFWERETKPEELLHRVTFQYSSKKDAEKDLTEAFRRALGVKYIIDEGGSLWTYIGNNPQHRDGFFPIIHLEDYREKSGYVFLSFGFDTSREVGKPVARDELAVYNELRKVREERLKSKDKD